MKEKKLVEFDSKLEEHHILNFEQYLGLLLKWNRTYNLTAINDPIDVYEKHFADSATPLQFIGQKAKIVDIGTGAGFPGVPIKILRDDLDVTMIEATAKKVSFCDHVIRELGLKKVRVISGRAEDKKTLKRVGKFDVVISRATLKLPGYIKVGSGYLQGSGKLIAMMGAGWSDELDGAMSEIKKAGLKLTKVHEYILPISQSKRALLIFEPKS